MSYSSRLKNLSATMLAAIIFSLLSSCSGLPTEITSARDMKAQLDDKGVDCFSFLVEPSQSNGAESLFCEDGSVNVNNGFVFSIWTSQEERDAGLTDFCFQLARSGSRELSLIAGETWVGFSESGLITAGVLSEELGVDEVKADSFCNSLGLEIGETLEMVALDACNQIYDVYDTLLFLEIPLLSSYVAGDILGKNWDRGYSASEARAARDSRSTLLTQIRRLESPRNPVPSALREESGKIILVDLQNKRNDLSQGWEKSQQGLDDLNLHVLKKNIEINNTNLELAALKLQLNSVLGVCQEYAVFDWKI